MRKTKKQHEIDIIQCIKENNIVCFDHIPGFYMDLGRTQLYNLKLNESDGIREALNSNKTRTAGMLFSKWIASDNATLQLAAYRLVCSDEERRKLNQQYIEATGKDGKDLVPPRVLTKEEARKIWNDMDKEY